MTHTQKFTTIPIDTIVERANINSLNENNDHNTGNDNEYRDTFTFLTKYLLFKQIATADVRDKLQHDTYTTICMLLTCCLMIWNVIWKFPCFCGFWLFRTDIDTIKDGTKELLTRSVDDKH